LDKQTIILIVLLGLLVIFWNPIMRVLGVLPEQPEVSPRTPTEEVAQPDTFQSGQPPTSDTGVAIPPTPAELTEVDTAKVIPEDSIIVETNKHRIVLSNYGGGPISFVLKNYKDTLGHPIEMLPQSAETNPQFIFNGGTVKANDFVYSADASGDYFNVSSGEKTISYTYYKEGVGTLTKEYTFYADRYHYDVILKVENRPAFGFEREYTLEWLNGLPVTERIVEDDYNSMWAMARQGDERVKFDDFDDGRFSVIADGATSWIASRSKYFTTMLMPKGELAKGAKSIGYRYPKEDYKAREIFVGLVKEIPFDQNLVDSFLVYVGPIDYEVLNAYPRDADDIIDIGTTPFVGWIIKIFAVPIMWLLPRMYEYIPNYGFVIILFSLAIKLITWPLTRKTIASMNALKDLQPKMEQLKEKHKNNPQALNREMMKLYKEAGVNPLSGCLPYLPQMPLFFALFSVFRSTILLRQAPFILWFDDLSRGALSVTDPYILLVIAMVVLMFVQQKMAMTDPKNKALTYIFPLMLGFFFYRASAGLVLYWTSFSFFSFMEQILFRRQKKNQEESAAAPEPDKKEIARVKKQKSKSKSNPKSKK